MTSRGIKWGTTSNPTTSITIGSGTGAFTTSLGSLSPGTEYYYRSWATNSAGTTNGTVKSFTTSALAPTVTTTDAASILSSSATLGGNVTNANGATVTSRGIKWGTTSNPTTSITIGSGTGVFTTSLGSLSPGTLYYYRSWATNSAGTTDGTVKSFTTSALAPTVTTTDAASILSSSATLGGNVTNANGATVTSRGIKWGTTSNPTTSITIGSGTGVFTTSLGSLSPSTLYYYRSWAANSVGTTNGTVKSFTTSALPPTVTTSDAAYIISSSAIIGGNVTNANGAAVTSRGIKWGTTSNPTTIITIGSGSWTGVFTTSLGSLSPGTLYYYRSWATNSAGTANGTVKSFTTNSLPTSANSSVSVQEDVSFSFSTTDFPFTDTETGSINKIKVTLLEGVGVLKLNTTDVTLNQEVTSADIVNLNYTSSLNGNGSAYTTFGFQVYDGTDWSIPSYTMTINVTGVNDQPVAGNAIYSINEAGNWSGAHTYDQATDVDAGTTFIYTLADSSVFGINQSSGLVTLKGILDFETTTSYTLTVTASDGALSNDASITVNVTNVNETPVAGNATYSINEAGTWSGAHTYDQATDVDAGTTFIYTLADSSVFGINQSSGLVTLKGILDFETTTSYTLTVTASDGALSNDASITVNVTNVNEAPVAGNATYSIDEDGTWSGAHTYDQATDVDAGTTFIYTLADSSVFGINQSSGLVTLKGILDFETTTSYTLTVTASDGALSNDASITVNVTNVNETPVAGNATYSIKKMELGAGLILMIKQLM